MEEQDAVEVRMKIVAENTKNNETGQWQVANARGELVLQLNYKRKHS